MVRALKVVLVVDLAVILGIVAMWLWWSRDDPRAAVGNGGLHGSVPPSGQRMPDLSDIAGIAPILPTPAALRGERVLLVATCFECRSGDIIGGGLQRLASADLPSELRVIVAGWDGTAAQWRAKWSLPERFELHVARTDRATVELTDVLKLSTGENSAGFAYLYDAKGSWRSTFPAQLMLAEDVVHDARAIAD